MRVSLPLAVATLVCTVTSYSESLFASSLIGSHFGPPSISASYDYVVIGGGTGGLTIATRLAQNSSNTVAVIEAGSFYELTNGNFSSIPAYGAQFVGGDPLLKNPLVDWVQYTEPLPAFGNRRILYTQGKTFGGNSARNYLLYMRSAKGAYDKWADQVGDQSYTFENLEPYLKKSVQFTPPNDEARPSNATPSYQPAAFDPSAGPLKVSYPNFSTSFATWVKQALRQLGFKDTEGFLGGDILGYSYSAMTLDRATQTRESSETSFLRQALAESSNINFYPQTLARQIVFDSNKKASGVLVDVMGSLYQLNATKEVILSAGVFRSPQLLMVSGIGPKDVLSQNNIPVVADRPGVGQQLVDHVSIGIDYAFNLITHSALADAAYAQQQVTSYLHNRTGALTNTGGEFIAFEKLPSNLSQNLSHETQTGLAANPTDWPDIELFFSDAFSGNNLDFTATIPPDLSLMYGTADCALVAPFSRGNVTINSSNTAVNPIVSLNLLSDVRDKEVAIAGFRRLREFFATSAMKNITIGPEAYPGSNVTTDSEILDAIAKQALTVFHAAGTCGMGKTTDPMAVIDSSARVIGVTGLRVVDASALPFLPPGHPQGTIYALAEKIADSINLG